MDLHLKDIVKWKTKNGYACRGEIIALDNDKVRVLKLEKDKIPDSMTNYRYHWISVSKILEVNGVKVDVKN